MSNHLVSFGITLGEETAAQLPDQSAQVSPVLLEAHAVGFLTLRSDMLSEKRNLKPRPALCPTDAGQ